MKNKMWYRIFNYNEYIAPCIDNYCEYHHNIKEYVNFQ